MHTTKAEVKLDTGGFNNMPGRDEVTKHLEQIEGVEIVDAEQQFWKNDDATLVFKIDCEDLRRFSANTIAEALVAIAELVHDTRPDEVHRARKGSGTIIFRLWWD